MKKGLLFIIFIFLHLVLVGQTSNSVIVLSSANELLNIGKEVYLLEDKESKLTIEDIQKPEYQRLFKKSEKEIPNFNVTKSKIWVKLTVANQTDEKIYLEVANFWAWYVDFYKPDSVGKAHLITQTGVMRPIKNREVANNFFLFELAKNPTPQTYYFSIQSESVIAIPLTLGTAKILFEKSYPNILFFGMFSGLMLVMFFYNLFVYFSVKSSIYLYYCGYLLLSLFASNYISGNYGYQWNIISYFPNYLFTILFFPSFFIAIFIGKLLKINRKQVFFKVSLIYLIVVFLCAAINLITGHYILVNRIVQAVTIIFYLYLFVYSLLQYRKGNTYARFIVFGFSFYLFGVIVYILQNLSLLPIHFLTTNGVVLGTSLEVLMFSLALGDKINAMRKEQEASQADLLKQTQANEKLVTEQNMVLEQKVAEKTKTLQEQNEELLSSEEEIRQNMEELQAIQEQLEHNLSVVTKQHELIVSSVNYALRIQNAIIPNENILKTYLDCFVFFRSRDIVSGDFYWFAEKENCKIVVVADCTGHGVSGAFMTMIGNDILNQIIHDKEIKAPHIILDELQAILQKTFLQSDDKLADGMDIAIVAIHTNTQNKGARIEYAGAMNPLYIVPLTDHSAENPLALTVIKADKVPIGGTKKGDFHYKLHTISNEETPFLATENIEHHYLPTHTNYMLYLSSDGYQDQFGEEQKKKFLSSRLRKMLAETAHLPIEEQKEIVTTTFDEWKGKLRQIDDVLLLGIKV